jgi:hypothetical protein
MHKTTTQEERQLMKLVEKLPVQDEEKNSWTERIRNGEMSAEMAEEIRLKLATPVEATGNPEVDEREQAARMRNLAELAMIVKRWRLSSQSRNFTKK